MGDERNARTPEEFAKEHARIQREIENSASPTPGGLTPEDIAKIRKQQMKEDLERDEERRDSEALKAQREHMALVDQRWAERWRREARKRDEAAALASGRVGALKRPENRIRLVAVSVGIFGIILLSFGLRTDGKQSESAATSVSTTLAPASFTTLAATSAVITPASATASASFTKVSGPCYFASQFTDNYSFEVTSAGLTLTQLSNNHITYGTIEPTGDFATEADGQAYSGNIDDLMANGQHFYTAEGCDEVYDFTMQLSAPLITTVELPVSTTTEIPTTTTVPSTGTSNGRNIPLVLLGIALLVGALALFFGGSRAANGPVAAEPRDADQKAGT